MTEEQLEWVTSQETRISEGHMDNAHGVHAEELDQEDDRELCVTGKRLQDMELVKQDYDLYWSMSVTDCANQFRRGRISICE